MVLGGGIDNAAGRKDLTDAGHEATLQEWIQLQSLEFVQLAQVCCRALARRIATANSYWTKNQV